MITSRDYAVATNRRHDNVLTSIRGDIANIPPHEVDLYYVWHEISPRRSYYEITDKGLERMHFNQPVVQQEADATKDSTLAEVLITAIRSIMMKDLIPVLERLDRLEAAERERTTVAAKSPVSFLSAKEYLWEHHGSRKKAQLLGLLAYQYCEENKIDREVLTTQEGYRVNRYPVNVLDAVYPKFVSDYDAFLEASNL